MREPSDHDPKVPAEAAHSAGPTAHNAPTLEHPSVEGHRGSLLKVLQAEDDRLWAQAMQRARAHAGSR